VSDVRFERIELRGIRAWGRHGANAGEQDVPQPLDIDLALEADLRAARASDDLADTIDYAALHATVARLVRTERYRLLERLADAILDAVMRDQRVAAARVSIAKPRLLDGATPVVSVSRARGEARERTPHAGS
jgi:7,8-dihydroneopterin aldolase/epimerase/oxygenase